MYYVYLAKKEVEPPQPHSRTDEFLVKVEQINLTASRSKRGSLKQRF
jgi:hypothetical protein